MARDSNSVTVSVVTQLSALNTFAQNMAAGATTQFNMTGLNLSAASDQSLWTAISYTSRMIWDPTRERVHFIGAAHTGGNLVSGAGVWLMYDAKANSFNGVFSREAYTWASPPSGTPGGHGYHGSTINPANGTLYRTPGNAAGGTIYRKLDGTTGAGAFTTGFIPGADSQNTGAFAIGLEWFPEANGGTGGLVSREFTRWYVSNAAVTAWAAQFNGLDINQGAASNYWIARANGEIHFGLFSAHLALRSNNTETTYANTPVNCGCTNEPFHNGLIISDPTNSTALLCFEINSGASKRVWRWTGASNAWTVIGSHGFNSGGNSSPFLALCPMSGYGAVLGWEHIENTGGVGTSTCRVFKVP